MKKIKKRMFSLALAAALLCIAGISTMVSAADDGFSAVAAVRAPCPDSEVVDGLSLPGSSLPQADALTKEWLTALNLSLKTGAAEDGGEETVMPALSIQAGGRTFTAELYDTPAARALVERLPMTVGMGELNDNEKYYYMSESLPVNSEQPNRIQAGDLMLYGSDCLVLFYESFSSSYSYTRLGSVGDPSGLADSLGSGSVEVTFRID